MPRITRSEPAFLDAIPWQPAVGGGPDPRPTGGATMVIQTWGGIGDILREISLLPVAFFHRRFGIRTGIRHFPGVRGDFHPGAGCPDGKIVQNLVSRLPACEWRGEGICGSLSKRIPRFVRVGLECFPIGRRLFSPGFQWTPADSLPTTFRSDRKCLVVQTHLAGLPSKKWPMDNWRSVLFGLRGLRPDIDIHILDPEGAKLGLEEGFSINDGLTLAQSIRLVESAHWLLSIDSWSKYVAAWRHIPQLVMVPDQRSDYPQLTAEAVWRHSYRGLQHSPEIRLLGLKGPSGAGPAYTRGQLLDFRPDEVLAEMAHTLSR